MLDFLKHNVVDSVNHSFLRSELRLPDTKCDGDNKDYAPDQKELTNSKVVTYGPDDITYTRNQYGFRSPEYSDISSDNFNILVMGCSFTQGTGLPWEHTWGAMLGKRIEARIKKPVKIYSVAKGGSGVEFQAIALNWVLSTGFKPDLVVHLVPSMYRVYVVDGFTPKGRNTYSIIPNFKNAHGGDRSDELFENIYQMLDPHNLHYRAAKALHLCHMLTKAQGIPMFWSTWCTDFHRAIPDLPLMGMSELVDCHMDIGVALVHANTFFSKQKMREAASMFTQTIARDYQHLGPREQYLLSELMYDWMVSHVDLIGLAEKSNAK